MGFVQQNFSSVSAVSILIDGLVAGAYTESTVLNSITNGNAISAIIALDFFLGTTINPGDYVGVYMARSLDGVKFDDVNLNLQALASFTELAAFNKQFFTIDTGTIGTLPPYWKLVILNGTSSNFGTGSNCSIQWKILLDM